MQARAIDIRTIHHAAATKTARRVLPLLLVGVFVIGGGIDAARAEEVLLSGVAAGATIEAVQDRGAVSVIAMSETVGPDVLAATVSGQVTGNHTVLADVSMHNTLSLAAAGRGIFVVQQSNGTGNLLQSVVAVAQPAVR